MRITTIALIINQLGDSFLMGLHQRGEGKGKLSFVGGKVADKLEFTNETPEDSVQREIFEETHIQPLSLIHQADIQYRYPSAHDKSSEVMKVYRVDHYQGEEREDPAEFRLTWVKINDLPHNKMWSSDRLWLPKLLAEPNKFHKIEFTYDLEKQLKSEKYATLGVPTKIL